MQFCNPVPFSVRPVPADVLLSAPAAGEEQPRALP